MSFTDEGKKTHYNNDYDNNILKFLFFYWYYQLNPVEHVADDKALTYVLANPTATLRNQQDLRRQMGHVPSLPMRKYT